MNRESCLILTNNMDQIEKRQGHEWECSDELQSHKWRRRPDIKVLMDPHPPLLSLEQSEG